MLRIRVYGYKHPGIGTPYGEYHGSAKLTEAKVREMRRKIRRGEWTVERAAQTFGISRGAASMAARGVTWSHVSGALTTCMKVPKLFDPRSMPIGKDGHDKSGRAKPRSRGRA